MEKIILRIQSTSDIITNSSSEVFMVYDDNSFNNIKELVNSMLSINGDNSLTFDDLFDVEASLDEEEFLSEYPDYKGLPYDELVKAALEIDEDNYEGYPWVNGYVVTAKSPAHDKIAEKLSSLDKIFPAYATFC